MKTLILIATLSSLALGAVAPVQAAGFKFLPFGFKLKPGAAVSLNPQPIPPGSESSIIIVSGKGGYVSLNPQPLPPKELDLGGFASLNPQPLPPGGETSIIIVGGMGGEASLNPQPLPPKEILSGLMF